ncbi:dihydrofolate reductase [Granulicoccus phenolivorans]|uniref:dihydrofolate reductase n=1 Tax=Granulicoccus phenolivorans TaxID=266854 RepID=UPI000419DD8F|nr:dihydrofolate reductase [Granulicoccus phenolivorans]
MTGTAGRPEIRAIAAVTRNGVIGADGDLVWRNREDFARLKQLTMGGVLVMGRKNYESIGRPLPGRESYVVTRNPDWSAAGVRTFASVDAALDAAVATGRDVWVFGGGEIYAAAWARTTWLEITEVDLAVPGDVYFPRIDPAYWQEVAREQRVGFSWVTYRRTAAEA